MLSACNSEKSNCLSTVAKKSYAPDLNQFRQSTLSLTSIGMKLKLINLIRTFGDQVVSSNL